jgi:tetratricopeptide (TPR) repeat protein
MALKTLYGLCTLAIILIAIHTGCATKKLGPMEQGIQDYEAHQLDAAKANFESILASDSVNAQAHYYLGRIAFDSAEIDTAVEQFEKAIGLDDMNSDYHFMLGVAYAQQIQKLSFFEQGQLAPKIKAEFEKAVEADPNNIEARIGLAQYHFNAPPIVGGSVQKAEEQVEAIRRIDPKQAHLFLAQIHTAKKEYDQAEAELKQALKVDAGDPDIHYQLGMLYQAREDYPAAFEAFENTIQSDADYMGAYYQLARTSIFSGDNIERGIECLKLYLNKDVKPGQPSHAHAHWRLGMLHEQAEDTETAKSEYRTALELDSSIEDAQKALERLGN